MHGQPRSLAHPGFCSAPGCAMGWLITSATAAAICVLGTVYVHICARNAATGGLSPHYGPTLTRVWSFHPLSAGSLSTRAMAWPRSQAPQARAEPTAVTPGAGRASHPQSPLQCRPHDVGSCWGCNPFTLNPPQAHPFPTTNAHSFWCSSTMRHHSTEVFAFPLLSLLTYCSSRWRPSSGSLSHGVTLASSTWRVASQHLRKEADDVIRCRARGKLIGSAAFSTITASRGVYASYSGSAGGRSHRRRYQP